MFQYIITKVILKFDIITLQIRTLRVSGSAPSVGEVAQKSNFGVNVDHFLLGAHV